MNALFQMGVRKDRYLTPQMTRQLIGLQYIGYAIYFFINLVVNDSQHKLNNYY